jgi:hypothetical protein
MNACCSCGRGLGILGGRGTVAEMMLTICYRDHPGNKYVYEKDEIQIISGHA